MKKLVWGIAGVLAAVVVMTTVGVSVAGQTTMSVSRTAACAGVGNREPIGVAEVFVSSTDRIFFYSEIMGADNPQDLRHLWRYEGKPIAEVVLQVGGQRYRTWSSKKIIPQWTGNWQVDVVDVSGAILASGSFVVR